MSLPKLRVTKRTAIQLTALLCVQAIIALVVAQLVVSHQRHYAYNQRDRIVDQARYISADFSGQYWHVNSASCEAELRPVRIPLSAPGSYIRNDLLVGMDSAIGTRTGLSLLQQQADKYRSANKNPACRTGINPLVINTHYRYQACKSNQLGEEPLNENDPRVCHEIKPLNVVSHNQPGSDIELAPFADSNSGVEAFPIATDILPGQAAVIIGYQDSRDIDPGAHPEPLTPSQLDRLAPIYTQVGSGRIENNTQVYRCDVRFDGNPDGFLVLSSDNMHIIGMIVHGQRIGGLDMIQWANYINQPPASMLSSIFSNTKLKYAVLFNIAGIVLLIGVGVVAVVRKSRQLSRNTGS